MLWVTPLKNPDDVRMLETSNVGNGTCVLMDGPIGPMLKLVCTLNTNPTYHNKVFYCGGRHRNGTYWYREDEFLRHYPEFDSRPRMVVDMELEEIERAEEILEELCRDR
jgi:hypothetical protein